VPQGGLHSSALLLPSGSGPLPVVPHCTRGERLTPATLNTPISFGIEKYILDLLLIDFYIS
jgi:hypothetical protein